jgi:hypothetical protein
VVGLFFNQIVVMRGRCGAVVLLASALSCLGGFRMSKIVVTRVPVDRPGTMLLVRFGVVIGISLLTLGGWTVLEMDHAAQRAACVAALRAHYPEVMDDGDKGQPGALHVAGCVAPRAGFEPATNRLTAGCSTTELPGITCRSGLPHGQGRAYIRAPVPAKAEIQAWSANDGVYPDWLGENPRSAHAGGSNGPGWGAAGGRGILVAAAARDLDGAGGTGGPVGRFAPGAPVPAAERSEDPALVADPKKKGPGRTGPEVWVMVGCLHGKTRERLAPDG